MLALARTVGLEKSELRLLCAVASKDEERPNLNGFAIQCSGGRLRVFSTDGHRLVCGETSLDGQDGCDLFVPLHVARAAAAMAKKDASVVFSADGFETSGCRTEWDETAAEPTTIAGLLDMPLVEARRMPLFALAGEYLADAKLLSAASGDDALVVHAPLNDKEPIHVLCGLWHYIVMPRAIDATADCAKQLCLTGCGVVEEETSAA